MKKKYIRPNLYLETFTLTQSIAKNCGSAYAGPEAYDANIGKPLLRDIDSCQFTLGYPDESFTVFLENEVCAGADMQFASTKDFDSFLVDYCYQAPNEDSLVFDS